MSQKSSRFFVEIVCFYLIIGLAGWFTYRSLDSDSQLIRFFIADLVMTLAAYGLSLYKRNSSVYDPYWTVIPFYFLVMWWLLYRDTWSSAHYIAALVISFWSWRLTHNWYRGFPGWQHEDWRYVNFRKQFGRYFEWINFSGIHVFPTLMVFFGMSGLFWFYNGQPVTTNGLFWLGCGLALTGTFLEFFADNTLHKARKDPSWIKGICIREGLWEYSRNPNYLGEMLFWIGLALVGQSAGAPIWTLSGAIGMILMFVFASIPMKEKRLMESRSDFASYKADVSVLIPWKLSSK